jgi:hypothetical protein
MPTDNEHALGVGSERKSRTAGDGDDAAAPLRPDAAPAQQALEVLAVRHGGSFPRKAIPRMKGSAGEQRAVARGVGDSGMIAGRSEPDRAAAKVVSQERRRFVVPRGA